MAIKVLVVDDSSFFRRRVSEIINADSTLEVIDTAKNGREAIDMVARLKPDVITMDIEMPVMDGITAVREIMAKNPTPVLMFSSLTHDGAKATLDALEAGALDFIPKKFEDIARDREEAVSLLQQRVKAIARRRVVARRTASPAAPATTRPAVAKRRTPVSSGASNASPPQAAERASVSPRFKPSGKRYKLVAIGTSTGGPVALQTILTSIPAGFSKPILLVQHMPATFTAAFAQRLNSLSRINVKQAEDGDELRPGWAYLAPGGKQMLVEGRGQYGRLRIIEGNDKVNYKPCVDITFASLAKSHQSNVLAMILTGMGADGRDGCRLLKENGSTIWAQDEASCVVYGMPQAVASAGLASEQMPLEQFSDAIVAEIGNG
ncbi:chemotaxis response regulator protein-glutamate methylesterase [Agarivorans sp. 1_MG-2023]|uniref:protein-glutamate methylesterase/protein-glutamine glutaminase n=1 Tax=Agarivorans sp. 1_MG-2023 TaxID=3062634 RepID=UPI0026E3AA64|nr:chemotaxis response regulator protein-glutamate methylesterase [Agarivorans sp. 1_MG-2023]MDO6764761.1 chemotaxis response regulator protein-glutamate methylesterase [Agarivorans sp. 1_MG-2023]